MRQIKFRGLRSDGKGWVYGSYIEFKGESEIMIFFDTTSKREHKYKRIFLDKHLITETIMPDEQGWNYGSQIRFHEVIPESVGQFTGLHDKNGVEIYEGDVLKRSISFAVEEGNQPSIYYDKVVYSGGGFKTVRVDDENRGYSYLENYVGHSIEIIGNTHTQDGGQEG